MVHRHPDQASVWLTLGTLLLYIYEQRKLSKSASACLKTAMHLGKTTMDVTKVSVFHCVLLSYEIVSGALSGVFVRIFDGRPQGCIKIRTESGTLLSGYCRKLGGTNFGSFASFTSFQIEVIE